MRAPTRPLAFNFLLLTRGELGVEGIVIAVDRSAQQGPLRIFGAHVAHHLKKILLIHLQHLILNMIEFLGRTLLHKMSRVG
mmetsp:Transcript_10061/g.15376  ORF Transcript_10061/g.15376 Transcript_10061/m.15376 type:complete len:81 (-) Transcript_10061:114-356(-)